MNEKKHINDTERASQVHNQKIKDQIEWEKPKSEHFGIQLSPLVEKKCFYLNWDAAIMAIDKRKFEPQKETVNKTRKKEPFIVHVRKITNPSKIQKFKISYLY